MGYQHAHSQQIVHRISRVIGHLEAIRGMVEADRDCSEVLTQIAAVKAAVNSIGRAVLKEHISHCIVDAVQSGDEQAIAELNAALDRFMK
ncbi:MAG: metal-sensing transcriptional repressor [Clostridia bacterium]|nr:metal-sensing transcriptional repressor [Clostridia bacterium]